MFPIQDTVPIRGTPVVTYLLIATNAAVFIFELTLPPDALERLFYLFGIVPARYTHPGWAEAMGFPPSAAWPFLTSMFLHGGWLHFIVNMWSLWIFGDNVEDRMGSFRFLMFYLLCGVAAGMLHWFTNLNSVIPTLGASGAIAGVMGAYFLLFPFARVITLVPVFIFPLFLEIPAFFYLFFWFITQLFSGTLSLASAGASGGIAWWAHIGGFMAGMFFMPMFLKARANRRRRDPRFARWEEILKKDIV